MRRNREEADDYYHNKILADRKVDAFLETHLDMWACMVLPGWMVGPGDVGPTSSGQVILDFLYRKLPGIPPATFSMVDARDVAEAMWLAAQKGRRGERCLVAGRHMSMGHLFQKLEQVSGIAAPRWNVPLPVLYAMAAANETWAGITKRSALISLATVRLTSHEHERTRFNHEKSGRELGIQFRPVEQTLSDTIRWYQQNGWLKTPELKKIPLRAAGQHIGSVENGRREASYKSAGIRGEEGRIKSMKHESGMP